MFEPSGDRFQIFTPCRRRRFLSFWTFLQPPPVKEFQKRGVPFLLSSRCVYEKGGKSHRERGRKFSCSLSLHFPLSPQEGEEGWKFYSWLLKNLLSSFWSASISPSSGYNTCTGSEVCARLFCNISKVQEDATKNINTHSVSF